MNIIVACEFSAVVREAFRKRNHNAWSCDLLESEVPSKYHFKDDIQRVLSYKSSLTWDLMIAHPPCTYLCVTGNKWFYHPADKHLPLEQRRPHPRFPDRKKKQSDALDFIKFLLNSSIKKICLENPIGIISTKIRKPDQIIQPFQFGHPEPKKTCLWLKNLPKLVPTKIVEPEYMISKSGKRLAKWYYQPSQSRKRQRDRERTFQGIADAMAAQWG